MKQSRWICLAAAFIGLALAGTGPVSAQLVDRTKAPNVANEGIAKTLEAQVGADRGDWFTPESSAFIINRDPFRAIRRGRQLFQRKFSLVEGQGSLANGGRGDVGVNLAIGAGMTDSCASCHGRPRGAAGSGGDVATRPDSRDAPHLFGLGLKEMIADEMTGDLRALRAAARASAMQSAAPVTVALVSKGVQFGSLTASADGLIDTSQVKGVDADLRVRPFFAHGGKISIREFVIGALNDEMGLQAVDPELAAAKAGGRMVTPAGIVLDGSLDQLEGPPAASATDDADRDGVANEIPVSLVDYLEFYLLNYFKPGTYRQTNAVKQGRMHFERVGCAGCHVPDMTIQRDRRVADVETAYDPDRGNLQPSVRHGGAAVQRHQRWHDLSAGQAGEAGAVRGARTSSATSSGTTSGRLSTSATTTGRSAASS